MTRCLGAPGRRLAAIFLGLLAATVVAGCSSAGIASDLATQLEYEGYTAVTVRLTSGSAGDTIMIRAKGNETLSDEESIESLQTAVWNTLPRRFDTLDIRVGLVHRQASYQQMSQRFGPRDRALDQRQIGADMSAVMIAVSVGSALLAAAVAFTAIMTVRRRRWEEREQSERFELGPPPSGHHPPALS